jgi:hypothetical protein
MPRKITAGVVGGPILGSIVSETNVLSSVEANANIVLDPNGTGIVDSKSDVQLSTEFGIRFSDGDNSNYVKLKSPATVANNFTLTLPTAVGTNGQIIQTDATGNLSFTDAGLPVNNRGTGDSNTYYPTFASNIAQEQELKISSTLLSFTPNPGLLTVNSVAINSSTASSSTSTGALTVTGGAGIGGALYANSISAVSITETSSIAYKENVNPITGALDTILKLNGVTYDRKDTTYKGEAGLIAEEVAPILPNVVSFKDGKPEGINYTKLSAYLIEAVKELKQEIKNLKR